MCAFCATACKSWLQICCAPVILQIYDLFAWLRYTWIHCIGSRILIDCVSRIQTIDACCNHLLGSRRTAFTVMSEFSQGFADSSCNCQSWCFSTVSLLSILIKAVITPTYPNWMQVNPRGEIYGGAERNFHCVPVGETFRDKLWFLTGTPTGFFFRHFLQ